MSITRFEEAKSQRYFYVEIYRNLLGLVIFSMVLNILIVLIMAYIFFRQPGSTYYSTNGRTSPVQLEAISSANLSSRALLPDSESDISRKT